MQQRNKLLSVFMSFLLSFALFVVPAHADEMTSDGDDSAQGPGVDNASGEMAQGSEDAYSSGAVGGDYLAGEAAGVTDEAADPVEDMTFSNSADRDGGNGDAASVAATDVLGFIYVDNAVVALGQEQNIVVALADENSVIENARLDMESLDGEKSRHLDASTISGDASLFTMSFDDESDVAAYQLTGIRYEVDGLAYYVDLADENDDTEYVFDVVTASVADAIEKSNEVSESDEVSAFAVDGDGKLVAKESVEAAIQVADAEGVQDVEAGESIVDQNMLDLDIASKGEASSQSSESDNGFADFFGGWFGAKEAWAAASAAREDYLIVALDPGHGGSDGGASANGVVEKAVNLSIAQYCYNELATYTGVTPYLTRTGDDYVGLQERVDKAVSIGADVFVSLHCNSSTSSGAKGSEVWVPNDSSYNYGVHVDGQELGERILKKLTSLGLEERSVKVRDSESVDGEGPFYYPDGSIQDYYTVIEASREANIPGIIVEHAFVSNQDDASKLRDDSFLKQLGQADASGIAGKYSLVKDSVAQATSTVKVQAHVSNLGWESAVYDKKVAGTTGKNFGVEAYRVNLQNVVGQSGGIEYRSYVGDAWQDWVSDGSESGTTGQAKTVQAIEMKLTGSAASTYDVYYRAHVSNKGWLGWAKNGQSAGSIGYNYNIEAIEVVVVAHGAAAPGSTETPFVQPTTSISYQAHVSEIGWQNAVSAGATAGTVGRNLSIEALKMNLVTPQYAGTLRYSLHCSDIGWQDWRSNGELGGTTGEARQTEAVKIQLTGELEKQYDIYYRVHSAEFGWLDWAKNGEAAGTEGYGYSMQAIEVKLVKKGAAAPGPTANHNRQSLVSYKAHVSNIGWQGNVYDGDVAGTTGRALAVEAIQIDLRNQEYTGDVAIRAHIRNIGWEDWKTGTAGTTGRALPLEAVQIRLTGDMEKNFDVYYCVHATNIGWMGWAKNGESAGTEGYAYSVEAMKVVLVPKGGAAPGSTSDSFRTNSDSKTAIMGRSQVSVEQMANLYAKQGKAYPSSTYQRYGAASIQQFCSILKEEAEAEGVRSDVLYAQVMVETGWLQFGGDVKAEQCNFGGLGATGNGVPGNSFNDWGANSVRKGLRAQAQHLKCYASAEPLNNEKVDQRWSDFLREKAPYVEWLSIPNNPYGTGWAADKDYASKLKTIMSAL